MRRLRLCPPSGRLAGSLSRWRLNLLPAGHVSVAAPLAGVLSAARWRAARRRRAARRPCGPSICYACAMWMWLSYFYFYCLFMPRRARLSAELLGAQCSRALMRDVPRPRACVSFSAGPAVSSGPTAFGAGGAERRRARPTVRTLCIMPTGHMECSGPVPETKAPAAVPRPQRWDMPSPGLSA
jgi:hypothetical protein